MATSMLSHESQMGGTTQRSGVDTDFLAKGSGHDKLGFAVKQATLATMALGWAPGEVRLTESNVELFASSAPGSEALDPEGREAMIHCGATLQHLQLALKRLGGFGRVALFPDLDQPTLAARVHGGCIGARDGLERQLFDSMAPGPESPQRLETPASEAMLELLGRTTVNDRGWLEFVRSAASRQRLCGLITATGRVRSKEAQVENQTLPHSDGTWGTSSSGSTTLQERFSRWRRPAFVVKPRATIRLPEPTDTMDEPAVVEGIFAVLKTKTDDKHGWLAAGQILGRLLLHVRTLGLSCTAFLDVLQPHELRSELRTAIGHKGFTQVILRFAVPRIEIPAVSSGVTYPVTATRSST